MEQSLKIPHHTSDALLHYLVIVDCFFFNILCVYVCVYVILSVTTAVNIFGVLTMGGRTSPMALAFRQPSNDIFCCLSY